MKELVLQTKVKVCVYDELDAADKVVVDAAREATSGSYAVYSGFHVGAAVRLANGVIVKGSNQENAAYPSGLCAERTTLFYANSQYPDVPVVALAIASPDTEGILSPCGACRQVMLETEKRYEKQMRVLLCGMEEVIKVKSARDLLPFAFDNY